MKRPTDDQILTALCCGPKCKVGPNTGYCHRWDFTTELTRVCALLDNMENGHDRGHQASSQALGRAEGAKTPAAEPRARHRESRSLGQQPRPAATDNAVEQVRLNHAFDGPGTGRMRHRNPCTSSATDKHRQPLAFARSFAADSGARTQARDRRAKAREPKDRRHCFTTAPTRCCGSSCGRCSEGWPMPARP